MPDQDLQHLRWTRLRGAVRNTRDHAAREHPLWILHGLFMYAMPAGASGEKTRFTFKPLAETGDAIQRHQVYPFELLFPGDDLALPRACAAALARHLAEPQWNFELLHLDPPELRCLADLAAAAAPWPAGVSELCLQFRTPLAYTPQNPRRPWQFDAPGLGLLLAHRLRHLLSLPTLAPPDTWKDLRTLSHFWQFVEYRHPAKSNEGLKTIAGNLGPLYLRGAPADLAAVRPWLLLGSELGCGLKLGPRGHFRLLLDCPQFDPLLAKPETYAQALAGLQQRADLPDGFPKQLGPAETATRELAAAVGAGQWQPAPATGFRVAKPGGLGDRLVALFPARDRLVHQALQALLTPVFDRLFEPQSHAFRPGLGVASARRLVQEAWQQGYTVALQADVESFFEAVDWSLLETRLDAALPRADRHTRATLYALVRSPLRLNRRPVPRVRGLLQGSPLSPLLANLYLDPFDEEMTRRGFCLVRYADDFLVLCRSEPDAQAALDAAREILTGLKLVLQDAKTAITPFASGFTFLGARFGGGFEEDLVEDTALDRTLFVRHPHAWVGVDHDAITVRESGRLVARLPLRRVREVVLLGAGGVSSRLIERCAQRGVAISFCTTAGRLQNVLWPHDRSHYELAAAHHRRHAAQAAPERLACARALVAAKLANYLAWFRQRPTPDLRPAIESLEAGLRLLPDAADLDALRGVEGMAARDVFPALNRRAPDFFRSQARRPGEQPDPWNLLLDFAYSLLFQRLNLLLRLRGLNPYLGFLHSPLNRFESLVCDLQEPFRARCDRLVLKLINRAQIAPADFTTDPATGLDLAPQAGARFLEAFAEELDTRLAGDPAPWSRLIETQVLVLERWARDGEIFKVFFSQPQTGPAPRPLPPAPPTPPPPTPADPPNGPDLDEF